MECQSLLYQTGILGCSLLEEFPKSHGNTVDDEHCFSSTDKRPVGEDHIGFGGHAPGMRLRSQGWLGRALPLVEFAYNNM